MRNATACGAAVVLLFAVVACDGDRPAATLPVAPSPRVPSTPPSAVFIPAPDSQPSSTTDPLVGRYQLDVAAGAGCNATPAAVTHRTYTADIDAEAGAYVVKLYDASFLQGLTCHDPRFPQPGTPTCNQFRASSVGNLVLFDFLSGPDENWNGNLIFEGLSDGKWIELNGSATGALQNGVIAADGSVVLSYWLGFPGASTYTSCRSDALRLTLTRR